jgi:hypothetical protein
VEDARCELSPEYVAVMVLPEAARASVQVSVPEILQVANESLVERGRIIFDLGFADAWKKELKSMNKHKVGRPFDFPDSYIEFLAFIKVGFDAPYRMVEGAVEALSEYISFIQDICFTQIRRRMVRLLTNLEGVNHNTKPCKFEKSYWH